MNELHHRVISSGRGAMPFFQPSLDEMNKEVLAWDMHQMLEDKPMYTLRAVPLKFASIDEYLDVFEPLLLEECRAQTLRSMQENETAELHLQVSAVESAEPFRLISFELPDTSAAAFLENDLVFISYERLDGSADEGEGGLPRPPQQFHALGIVQGTWATSIRVKLYLPELPTPRLTPSQHKRLCLLRKVMVPSSGKWYLRKLSNMVTINREFQALYSARDLAISPMILAPADSFGPSAQAPPSLEPSRVLLNAIEAKHNPSQLIAIRNALCGRGITLIQGPPGTGKTNTILGMLSVLLSAAQSPHSASTAATSTPPFPPPAAYSAAYSRDCYRKASPWLSPRREAAPPPAAAPATHSLPPHPFPRANETDMWVHLGKTSAEEPPKHVLVCAPSNAATDEIVSRLLQRDGAGGMLDAQGEPYIPMVVRVGPNVKETLLDVALDTMARQRMVEGGEHTSHEAARLAVLNEAQIVCTTLSCAGYTMFSQLKVGFDTVLIDEAAQAVEVSTLIPLKYGCRRLILIGDPEQLPATVFSQVATQHNYEQSLFQRLQLGGQRVTMLTTQYRMHPHISRFPGARFYLGALTDAAHLSEACEREWHKLRCFAPYVVYDVADGKATASNSSWLNETEACLAMLIARHLVEAYPRTISPLSIGIVTPYNGQVRHIRRLFASEFGDEMGSQFEVNSVDGFQGREKDIMILSCVRSDQGSQWRGIGFLKDERRVNVMLTRAKFSAFVLGHGETLKQDKLWGALFEDAAARGCVVTAHTPIRTWFEAAKKLPAKPHTAPVEESADALASADADAPAPAPAPKRRRGAAKGS